MSYVRNLKQSVTPEGDKAPHCFPVLVISNLVCCMTKCKNSPQASAAEVLNYSTKCSCLLKWHRHGREQQGGDTAGKYHHNGAPSSK